MNREEGYKNKLNNARRRLFQDDDRINGEDNGVPNGNVSVREEEENTVRQSTALQEAQWDNLQNCLKESRDTAKEKWNFDFETETPLEGDWEWERVPVNETAIASNEADGRQVQEKSVDAPASPQSTG